MTQTADGEQRAEVAKEPVAAPESGSENFWFLARVLSLLLMAVALFLPWTAPDPWMESDYGFQIIYYLFVQFAPLLLVPGVAAFLLGGALLLPDRSSPRLLLGLSRAYIVALCLALPIGFGALFFIVGTTNGDADLSWGGFVYLVSVATAIVVEIRTLKTMRGND